MLLYKEQGIGPEQIAILLPAAQERKLYVSKSLNSVNLIGFITVHSSSWISDMST